MNNIDEVKDRLFNVFGEVFKMVYVKGGTCVLGSSEYMISGQTGLFDGCTLHTTELKDYYIGESLVTENLHHLVTGRTLKCEYARYPEVRDSSEHYPIVTEGIKDILYFIFKLNQITGVNFRLPTLDEWEFAAKGGNKSLGYRYSGSNNIDEVAWYTGNSSKLIHPIKKKKPNELGIYDMTGNLLEYCACNFFDTNPNSWNNAYRTNQYNFELYRGGCYDACAEECEITFLDDWAQDWYECRGFRLCLSAENII